MGFTIAYGVAATVLLLITTCLTVRFLIVVPKELSEIKSALVGLTDNNEDSDNERA